MRLVAESRSSRKFRSLFDWTSRERQVEVALATFMLLLASALVALAFLPWISFGVTKLHGVDADAATGVSDGWAVVLLAIASVLLSGGVVAWPKLAQLFLPAIALAGLAMLFIAGYDSATHWQASGLNDRGSAFLEAGSPTAVTYLVASLGVVSAVSAAFVAAFLFQRERASNRD